MMIGIVITMVEETNQFNEVRSLGILFSVCFFPAFFSPPHYNSTLGETTNLGHLPYDSMHPYTTNNLQYNIFSSSLPAIRS